MAEEILEEECDIITLVDDKGEDVDFYHVATIDYKEDWYVFLQPCTPIEGINDDEVLIYKLGTDNEGEDTFIPIETQEELDAVYNEYLKEVDCDCEECGEECDCAHQTKCDCGCDK